LFLELGDHTFVGLEFSSKFEYLFLIAAEDFLKLILILADELAFHEYITCQLLIGLVQPLDCLLQMLILVL
jgi:hypothetical protein